LLLTRRSIAIMIDDALRGPNELSRWGFAMGLKAKRHRHI
jgi:hypothetical protein